MAFELFLKEDLCITPHYTGHRKYLIKEESETTKNNEMPGIFTVMLLAVAMMAAYMQVQEPDNSKTP
jgi:hypothetical protein